MASLVHQVEPAEVKIPYAITEKAPEAATMDTPVEVFSQQPAPVTDIVFPPSVETLTPANPLPQTALTPLIGNIPPQAVESLKAAAQQAASVLPLQPTQELLEQQASTRTTPLDLPVDQGIPSTED